MDVNKDECPGRDEETWVPSEITCLTCGTKGEFHAFIYNLGTESVCLVTDYMLGPQDIISITATGGVQEKMLHETVGVVQWSKEVERENLRLYMAGVKMPRIKQDEKPAAGNQCEMCGRCTGEEEDVGHGMVWLCPECHEHMEMRPEKIDEIISRFLIGNPL